MKQLIYTLAILLLLPSLASCKDSNLEGWDPYLSTGQSLTVNISLDKYIINVDAYACSESVEVTSDGGWTVASDAQWCSVSEQSGSKKQTLALTIQENTTAQSRDCNLTFTTTSGNKSILKVSQGPKSLTVDPLSLTFSKEGGKADIAVTSNGNYTFKKHADWLNVTENNAGGYTVVAQANETPGLRSDTLIIAMTGLSSGELSHQVVVRQSGTDYYLYLEGNTGELPSSENSLIIQVTTEDEWSAQLVKEDDWLKISPTTGTGNANIVLSVHENNSVSPRNATIAIEGKYSGITKTLEVEQKGKYLSVNQETITKTYQSVTEFISVTSDDSWTVTKSNDSWITLSPSEPSGDGDGGFSITLSENKTINERNGTVTVKGTRSGITKSIQVNQSAYQAAPIVLPKEGISEDSHAITKTVEVFSNEAWKVEKSNHSWFSLSPESGNGNGSFEVNLKENNSPDSRTGSITVTGISSGLSTSLPVFQSGKSDYTLTVSPSSISESFNAVTKLVTISSDDSWNIEAPYEWITVSKSSGSGNDSINVTLSVNSSQSSRFGSVTVVGVNSNIRRNIEITQYGAPPSDIEINGYDSEDTNLDNSR